jgi:hypothetical protein
MTFTGISEEKQEQTFVQHYMLESTQERER